MGSPSQIFDGVNMTEYTSPKWILFVNRPTPLLKRDFMKRCYLWLGKINGVGLGRVLSIGTKDGDAVYLLESEYRKNIAQVQKDNKNGKVDLYFKKWLREFKSYKLHGVDQITRCKTAMEEIGARLIYSHFVERALSDYKFGALLKLNSEIRDRGAKIIYPAYDRVYKFLKEKFSRDDFNYLLLDEIVGKRRVGREEFKIRKKFYVAIMDKKQSRVYIGREALRVLKKDGFEKTKVSESSELKGLSAYHGIVRGKVVVIKNLSDFKKTYKNRILVSPETIIEYAPFLKYVKAIVADHGGITCHAAIAAREFKVPCVVGTKIATRIFKDGDMVEVDAEKGIVKKI